MPLHLGSTIGHVSTYPLLNILVDARPHISGGNHVDGCSSAQDCGERQTLVSEKPHGLIDVGFLWILLTTVIVNNMTMESSVIAELYDRSPCFENQRFFLEQLLYSIYFEPI